MTEEDYKSLISLYQQKSFELFNSNVVLETQVNSLNKQIKILMDENEKLRKNLKSNDDY